ncbi:histidine kinase [Leptolyngbya sp. AN02str]|uniref:histidine kinase n=1 Tax=Leptolyngbya sp. AN02str TaxID=3423363 RepID=UPI003D31B9E4
MEALPNFTSKSNTPLQLLLFVDKRPSSNERIRQIQTRLTELGADYPFDLQVIDVSEQPHLVEHFKLVATPALVKIHPEPRQTLAGSDLVGQIERAWVPWRQSVEQYIQSSQLQNSQNGGKSENDFIGNLSSVNSVAYVAEMTRLSDEIFRLNQEKEELQEQLQFKDRLIAMLAHDLRNPLTAVSIALETLDLANDPTDERSDRLTPAIVRQLIRHARAQAKALDRMITDVLQAARGNAGKLQIQPQKLDLKRLCQDVLHDLQSQFEAKAQHIVTDIPSDLPSVYADADRIRQVMTNLLDNASKYTPDSGTIEVSILHRTMQKVQVTICDNGPGIPEENKEKIFEDRFRLERDHAKDGYGIGLALCQRIVRAHFGQIWVDSVTSQGSCFHFTLPVYRA